MLSNFIFFSLQKAELAKLRTAFGNSSDCDRLEAIRENINEAEDDEGFELSRDPIDAKDDISISTGILLDDDTLGVDAHRADDEKESQIKGRTNRKGWRYQSITEQHRGNLEKQDSMVHVNHRIARHKQRNSGLSAFSSSRSPTKVIRIGFSSVL